MCVLASAFAEKNVNMSRVTSQTLAQQLMTSAGPALSVGSTYDLWAYGPIALDDTDALTYSYTFAAANAASARNSDAFTFPSTTMPVAASISLAAADAAVFDTSASANSSSSSSSNSSAPAADAINTSSVWNGEFQVDSSCVPAADCCCGVGQITLMHTRAQAAEAQRATERTLIICALSLCCFCVLRHCERQ